VATKRKIRRASWGRGIALVVLVMSALSTMFFGFRAYGSFLLLRSAHEVGLPIVSNIRPWMTLDYVAAAYRTPREVLMEHLGLSAGTEPNTTLKSLADRAGISRFTYTQRVQRAIAELAPGLQSHRTNADTSWLAAIADDVLAALLVYGYPVLALTLLLGAMGLPLPDGVAATIAGSLVSQGRMSWFWAVSIAVAASVLGDAVGYGLGRFLSREAFERHGHWFGFTPTRQARVRALFDRWGSLTILFTRTFISYLSSVASLLAGISRFRLSKFLAIALTGRLIWAAAYIGLGYGIGSDWQAATSFLTNLSVLLLSVTLFIAAAVVVSGENR
jgi:membrane protein DedA with SNARE-associated domain